MGFSFVCRKAGETTMTESESRGFPCGICDEKEAVELKEHFTTMRQFYGIGEGDDHADDGSWILVIVVAGMFFWLGISVGFFLWGVK